MSEKAAGTELAAIVGMLQQFVDAEEERLRREDEAAWRKKVEDARIALEQRFLSGADCKWTQINGSKEFYTRRNGRAFRLTPTKLNQWDLHRIADIDDRGAIVGTYGARGDATKALAKIAYEPEPRW